MIIKHEVGRPYQNPPHDSSLIIGIETKVVSRKERIKLCREGWFYIRTIYPGITPLLDRWKKLSFTEKIRALGFSAFIVFILLKYL